MKKTVYQRIMDAAKKGKGMRLTAEEVDDLSRDDAIQTRSEMDRMNAEGTPDGDIY
jgi:DNA invertase Pin-like site-specific DNA recombinase